jgi:hypothetical protein
MKKFNRLPREQVTADGHDDGLGANHDGLPVSDDVEGHGTPSGDGFLPGMPGTGGDNIRRPVGGGELEDDVEGHAMGHTKGERFLPGMPGTGGDEIAVEVEPDGTAMR